MSSTDVKFLLTDGNTLRYRCYALIYILFIFYYLFYFNYFIILFFGTSVCTDVMVLRLLFIYFHFWDGVQNSIPKVWQSVFSSISI